MNDVATYPGLKLVALDDEDLAVLSAHAQDMVVQPSDFAWLAQRGTFAFAGERFDWVGADGGQCERVACGLHFDRVLKVRQQNFEGAKPLNLLSIRHEATDAPAGTITLIFSGEATVRLGRGMPRSADERPRTAPPLRL